MKIFVPSYSRWDCATTMDLIPSAKIVVPESQADKYKQTYGKRVIKIFDHQDGSPTKKKNAILEMMQEGELAWIMDDDLEEVRNIQKNKILEPEEIEEVLENHFCMMQDLGAGFGGFAITDDFVRYQEFKPFSFYKISYSAFCVRKTKVKHDERLSRVDDIDFFLQVVKNKNLPFRDNRYFFKFKWNDSKSIEDIKQKGGIIGGHEQHKDSTEIVLKKWGKLVRVKDGRITGVNLPIKSC